jgi:HNH endonuclease
LNPDIVRQIWERARYRCEYCHLPASAILAPFQIDHIIARQHGGSSNLDNLALCCIHCNRFKGPNIAGVDSSTGEVVRLFHPRRDIWTEHFRWSEGELQAVTPSARATVQALSINDPEMVNLRRELVQEGAIELS